MLPELSQIIEPVKMLASITFMSSSPLSTSVVEKGLPKALATYFHVRSTAVVAEASFVHPAWNADLVFSVSPMILHNVSAIGLSLPQKKTALAALMKESFGGIGVEVVSFIPPDSEQIVK
jgi:hypothetical protein